MSTAAARPLVGGLAAVLNSTFARLERAFGEQKIFTTDASHELRTPLTQDPARLRQVIVNLILNAIRYNREGGTIEVAKGVEGTQAYVTVRDTGIGVSADDLPHLFKRFFRADKARSHVQGDTGLGLSVCQAIIDRHAGTLTVENVLGQGSVFRVRIPAV